MDDWMKAAFAILLIVLGIGTYIAYFGRGKGKRPVPAMEGPPERNLSVESPRPPAEALARIKTIGAAGKVKISVASEDPARGLVVLSDELTRKGFANFFPCFADAGPRGGSTIVVGIVPPPPQRGPAVKARLKAMAEAVRAAVA
jgi:hypothetical protein